MWQLVPADSKDSLHLQPPEVSMSLDRPPYLHLLQADDHGQVFEWILWLVQPAQELSTLWQAVLLLQLPEGEGGDVQVLWQPPPG